MRCRWLGRVHYRDALAVQTALFKRSGEDYLLLLEHPHVFTMGVRAKPEHLRFAPEAMGAEVINANRGGDVTYHGPGQLVGYPILNVATRRGGGMADTAAYVFAVEQLIIDALNEMGVGGAGRRDHCPGVWIAGNSAAPRKIASIGVRLSKGRSMHGFALNVNPDLSFFDKIVPCGIRDVQITSMAAEGLQVDMKDVVDCVTRHAATLISPTKSAVIDRQDVAWRNRDSDMASLKATVDAPVRLMGRLAEAGVNSEVSVSIGQRKPRYLLAKANMSNEFHALKKTMRSLDLVTVCEEAGCPNIYECWNAGTATFMINGERCTRACGFCLVDTSHPKPLDLDEPFRVAKAVADMGLSHAVITAVARDDLIDGGAAAFARVIETVHRDCPGVTVEVLIPDCKGDPASLDRIFAACPEVLNHNVETVPRLQRAVRPSASYARSLAVLSRAKDAGLVTKSGMILGMGEELDEVRAVLTDLRAIGVDIVTIGQYLRPTANHVPVAKWWTEQEFDELRVLGESMGFAHVQSSPLTRSSYHAKQSAAAASTASAPGASSVSASVSAPAV